MKKKGHASGAKGAADAGLKNDAKARQPEAPKEGGAENPRLLVGIFALGGLAAGIVSYFMSVEYALPIGIIILFGLTNAFMRLSGKKKLGTSALGGIFLYVFVWLDMWVFLSNFL